jgi:hypothetical protein
MIYVPDRGFNKWIPSHPVGYISLLTKLNDEHGGKVRPLIKLFKQFRNVHMINRRPKSYWLGALVIQQITKDGGLDTSKCLAEIFYELCSAVYQQYDHLLSVDDTATPNIADPMLGHNISWNWDRSHFETFMRRVDDARNWAGKALSADDRDEAVSWWQKIFGSDCFPKDIVEVAKGLASSALPGQAFINSSGKILNERSGSGISTPVKRTTFHGET